LQLWFDTLLNKDDDDDTICVHVAQCRYEFSTFFEILIFLMLHLMNFCPFITFSKLFLLGHAKTSRTQRRFTYDKYNWNG